MNNIVEELNPLVDKISEEVLKELNLFLINCSLEKEDRVKLIKILLKTLK
jgi:hypothetical protein